MPYALLTPDDMARADALAAAHLPFHALMENAGRAVARAVRRRFAPCRTLVLCGPGNNGGDGYVVARHLAQAGWPVRLAALAPPRDGTDADLAASRADEARAPRAPFAPETAARAALVIDAVFGAGLARDVDGPVADTLRAAARLVAIDTPSGIDGATGAVRGFAPRAALTVTFFRRKPGHLLLPGRDLCGETVVADIGIPAAVLDDIAPSTFANAPGLWRLPRPTAAGHKYTRGFVTILGGPAMTGAARLAAEGARRAGAGMTAIAATDTTVYRAAAAPGIIVADNPAALVADPKRAWVVGPGAGVAEVRALLPALLAAGRAVVADADCFTAHANDPDGLRGATILTPHAGEFARVFGPPGPDRLAAVRAAAARVGAVVLLKGSDTIVAAPDGRAAINESAPPWLGTAGAGDVLAGIVAALLAQGMPAWDAACAGAWLHGRAACFAGPGLVADDLPGHVAAAIAEAAS